MRGIRERMCGLLNGVGSATEDMDEPLKLRLLSVLGRRGNSSDKSAADSREWVLASERRFRYTRPGWAQVLFPMMAACVIRKWVTAEPLSEEHLERLRWVIRAVDGIDIKAWSEMRVCETSR